MMADSRGPIFVTGSSRSGTGLMRACLNRHPEVHLAGETHYFDDLRPRMAGGQRTTLGAADRARCEDYFLAIAHGSYHVKGDPEEDPATRERLRAYAQGIGDGPDAYFEAFCRLEAEAHGKHRWGEKTPRHVFRIADILESYPSARVICMVRDPRGLVASYRDRTGRERERSLPREGGHAAFAHEQARQRKSADPLVNSLLWRGSVGAAREAHERFGEQRVHVQRYEELVTRPGESLRRVARWLDLDYFEAMLDVQLGNTSYTRPAEVRGISINPAGRWRDKLTDAEIALVQSACRRLMQREGYAAEPVRVPFFIIASGWTRLPLRVIRATAANRARADHLPATCGGACARRADDVERTSDRRDAMTDTRLLPNLLIPGVTKAGTTSLFWYLAQHPDICPASVKEIDYFAPLRYSEPLESSLEDYTRHFSHCAGERYRLDASPTSFYGGPELTQAVARTLPDVKIVIALRDPVDRFWSGYRYKKLKGGLDESVDFRAFFERCLRLREAGEDARKENALYRALSIGRYVDSLPDWFDVFDARVRLIFFEDLAVSPQPAVAGLCRWLGIDDTPTHRFDYGVSNKTLKPRSRLLHRGARWINRSADRLLHVNSHRRVKGLLRDAYHRLNASSHTETFSAEDRRLVQDFYAGANELLAKELSERGYRNLPRWLAIPTTP